MFLISQQSEEHDDGPTHSLLREEKIVVDHTSRIRVLFSSADSHS